jgi:hypothetical protein
MRNLKQDKIARFVLTGTLKSTIMHLPCVKKIRPDLSLTLFFFLNKFLMTVVVLQCRKFCRSHGLFYYGNLLF